MLPTILLVVAVVGITVAETVVLIHGGRADRQSTSSRTNRNSKVAALWAGVFELLVYAGMILIAREEPWLAIPGSIAASVTTYWALERRRKKFRSRVKKKKSSTPNTME
jgi:hypothetical protein